MENKLEQALKEIETLKQGLSSLSSEFYLNNFSANQTFNKYSNFTSRIKVPNYSTNPTKCEVGEIIENSGKLYICSATDTWTVCGDQTA